MFTVKLMGIIYMSPKQLDAIADVVLNYRPKSKQPKPRKRKKTKRVKRG